MVKATYEQTFIGVWFHDDDLPFDQQDKMKVHLNKTFYYYQIFVDKTEFYAYIDKERLVSKIFVIISISDLSLSSIVELSQQYPEFFAKVYVFLPTKIFSSACFNTTSMDDLFEEMNKDIEVYISKTNPSRRVENDIYTEPIPLTTYYNERPPPSLSVFNSTLKQSMTVRHLSKESLKFVSFLSLRDIILQKSYGKSELTEMCIACRGIHSANNVHLKNIDDLQRSYDASEAIQYYTKSWFLFRTINQVCRTENCKDIYKFRIYISDLHKRLNQLDIEQERSGIKSTIKKVLRGKRLSGSVLQQLIDNNQGLILIHSFLSTTSDSVVSNMYSGDKGPIGEGHRSTTFEFEIDRKMKQPYANISRYSTKPHEEEVLFSLGTIWRIKSVSHDEKSCKIGLMSCNEHDSDLNELLEKHASENVTWLSLGDLLVELGDEAEAEWSYRQMLAQQSHDNKIKGILYYKIGMIQFDKKLYDEALLNLIEAESLLRHFENKPGETTSSRPLYMYCTGSPLLRIYNNMGLMFEKNDRFQDAVDHYEKALKEKDSNSQLATVHYNLGLLYFRLGNYIAAHIHHVKASELIGDSHPWLTEFKKNLKLANDRLIYIAKNKQKG
jgi:tetratricopeptide (TPR) repeat protein